MSTASSTDTPRRHEELVHGRRHVRKQKQQLQFPASQVSFVVRCSSSVVRRSSSSFVVRRSSSVVRRRSSSFVVVVVVVSAAKLRKFATKIVATANRLTVCGWSSVGVTVTVYHTACRFEYLRNQSIVNCVFCETFCIHLFTIEKWCNSFMYSR